MEFKGICLKQENVSFLHKNVKNFYISIFNLHGKTEAMEKMSLFLELVKVLLCILMVEKNILVVGEGSTQGLDSTTITTETKYPINFRKLEKKNCVNLDIKPYSLCLGNISKDFTLDNM